MKNPQSKGSRFPHQLRSVEMRQEKSIKKAAPKDSRKL